MNLRKQRLTGFINQIIMVGGIAVVTGTIGFIITTSLGWSGDLKAIAVGSIIIFVAIIGILMYRLRRLPENHTERYMRNKIGIDRIYDNLLSCQERIQADFLVARNIKLLLQIGRREYGDGEKSWFWLLSKNKNEAHSYIRVLHASKDSPFLSEERAKARGNKKERWDEDIRRLKKQIELLVDIDGANIEAREHSEPFLWRIFIFDEVAYVSSYMYTKHNDEYAKVYRIVNVKDSIFSVFDLYYEYLWHKYALGGIENPIGHWANWPWMLKRT